METYFFSPALLSFSLGSLRSTYELQGAWPADAVEVSEEEWREYGQAPAPEGMRRGADVHGRPSWVPIVYSAEELALQVCSKRDGLLRGAAVRIAPLQDAFDIGDATADEEAALLAWKRYRVALNRIEMQSGFPLAVEWPPAPSA